MNKRFISLTLIVIMAITFLVGCSDNNAPAAEGPADSDDTVRVAVLLGSLGDKGYNDEVFLGVTEAEEDFEVEIDYVEIIENSEIETQLRMYADSESYDLIIASNATYADTLKEIADDYPDQRFSLADTTIEGFDNVHSTRALDPEQTFLSGVIAGLVTQDERMPLANEQNVIGFIGGQDTPISRSGVAGFMAGARYVNPDVNVIYNIVGSYTDPSSAKELAMTAYGRGADVISHNAGGSGLGVFDAAEESNKYVIGSSKATIDPERSLVTSIKRIDLLIYQEIESIVNETWEPGVTVKGLADEITGFDREEITNEIPEDIMETVEAIRQEFIDGKFELPNDPNEIEAWAAENSYEQ